MKDVNDLIRKLKEGPIARIGLKDLVGPDGYAKNIARSLKVSRVQMRRVYNEFKQAFSKVKRKKQESLKEEDMNRLYMLFPILEYQKNRKPPLIDEKLADLMNALIENVDRFRDRKNVETAEKFLTALIAYSKE